MHPNGSTLTAPPSLVCPVHGRAPPGALGHLCVHIVRAPYRNLGYKKATARADVPSWTTAGQTSCTRSAAITPHCRVSHSNGKVPPGAPSHPCAHSVRASCRNLGCKKATARADVPPWTTAGQVCCTRTADVTPHSRVSYSAFAHWSQSAYFWATSDFVHHFGSFKQQRLCSQSAHLWAVSAFISRSQALGTPQVAWVMQPIRPFWGQF